MANDPLGKLRIAAPCPTSWEGMAGDERIRHCSLCSLNVYNFAEMTRDEVTELIARTEGRICARLYQRADGTVITRDCPTGLRALRQRASRVAAALVTAMLTLPALAFGGETCSKPSLKTRGAAMNVEIERLAKAQAASFSGVIHDQTGTPLPGVSIRIRDEATNRQTTVVTDSNGGFTFAGLDDGLYVVDVTLAGFTPAFMDHLELKGGEVAHARIALQMDTTVTVTVGVMISVGSNLNVEPGKVTVSSDLLNRLPL